MMQNKIRQCSARRDNLGLWYFCTSPQAIEIA
jgi:hypothetical protein